LKTSENAAGSRKMPFMDGHELIRTPLDLFPGAPYGETFEKCSILFKAKEGENFNRRNTLSILRIKI